MSPESHAKQRAALADRVRRDFAAAWARVDPHAVRASWLAEIPRLLVTLTIAQQVAAASADAYVASSVKSPTEREVILGAFSHVASDGRALDSLLERPAVVAVRALQLGEPLDRSMAAGALTAQLIGHTQVADAGRVADLVAVTANPAATGYVRLLVGRTCARCMVLAGRRYSWRADFKRHPRRQNRCDCTVVPEGAGIPFRQPVSPQQAFREMLPSEQDKVFGKAGAESIRQGADISQVVNARSGMYSAHGRLLTTAGGARRVRLMPEQIIREAGGNRQEAVRLLGLHGYLAAPRPRSAAPRAVPVLTFEQRTAVATTGEKALRAVPSGLGRAASRARGDIPLTRQQRTALREYESTNYYVINGQLRRGAPDASTTRIVGHIDAAMASSAVRDDLLVWRGITSPQKIFGDRLAGDLTGFSWREDAYTSTTADKKVARDFLYEGDDAGSLQMRILLPKGARAVRISEGGYGGQSEILLSRGRSFRVVADRGVSPQGARLIDVEVSDA